GGPPRGPFGGPPRQVEFWTITPSDKENGGEDFSISYFSASAELPNLFRAGPVSFAVQPQFETLFLGGPSGVGAVDLPSNAYGLAVDLRADYKINRRMGAQFAVSPGLYTDFDNMSSDAFRVPARLIVTYFLNEQWVLFGGVVYTTQPDLPIIPVAGGIYSPNENWRLEILFPRPRLVYRWSEQLELSALVTFNNNTYAVETELGDDVLQYRDFRAGLGAEWFLPSGRRFLGEAGVAFGRSLDFEDQPDHDVDPGLFLRVSTRF
ncbi:MAG: DUF6268 family outer membrane beta-barrel protein, partial [Planctomycetia bacterium]